MQETWDKKCPGEFWKYGASAMWGSSWQSDSSVAPCSSWKNCFLVVCPRFGPPAVEHFSKGDEVTLTCNHSLGQDVQPIWFVKTACARHNCKVSEKKVSQFYKEKSSINMNVRNKINISFLYDNRNMEDRGEYCCTVVDKNNQCIAIQSYSLSSRRREASSIQTSERVRQTPATTTNYSVCFSFNWMCCLALNTVTALFWFVK